MGMVVALWLLALGEGDRRTGRLPTAVLWPGIAGGAAVGGTHPVVLVSGLVAVLPYAIAHLMGQVGGGDVKLAFVIGALAADPVLAAVAVVLVQVVALVGFAGSRRRRQPHGPAMCAVGAVCAVAG
ncbi:prepilin peptidase [Gordonia crocea]|nr:prepilin peptidase [Gordonia crocea]